MDLTSQTGALTPIMSPNQHLPISGVRYAAARRCTCRTRPAPTYRSFGTFYYQDRTKNVHESTCPLREQSARKVSLGLKIAMPALFSKVVQLVVSADFGAGGISISPAIKFPATIVDRKQSKGFQLLDFLVLEYKKNRLAVRYGDSLEMMRRIHVDALERFCKSVTTHLFPLLENGSVSTHEQDLTGATLLWVRNLRIKRLSIVKAENSKDFAYTVLNYNSTYLDPLSSDHVCEVIGTMIQHFEADPNVIVEYVYTKLKILPYTDLLFHTAPKALWMLTYNVQTCSKKWKQDTTHLVTLGDYYNMGLNYTDSQSYLHCISWRWSAV